MKTLVQLVNEEQKNYNNRIILAKVNNRLKEIRDVDVDGCDVEFITTDMPVGNENY